MPGWYGAEDRGAQKTQRAGMGWKTGEVLREWGGQGYLQYWGASKFHPEQNFLQFEERQ